MDIQGLIHLPKELSDSVISLASTIETTEEHFDSELDESITIELNRGRELLQKILEEQAAVEASIIASKKQIIELRNTDVLASKENTAPANKRITPEAIIDNVRLRSIQKSQKTSEDLCIGLRTLTGVKMLEVTESGEEGGVRLLITIGECSFAITLDADKRISDIIVTSGKIFLNLKKLLQDSRILPCPQDLRYAVFAVGASQNSVESVKNHLPELRKSCIVKVLGPLKFELGLPNSISAVVSVHDCYPEVPAGVHIDSLTGLNEDPKELEFLREMKALTNSGCFRTISVMFAFLMGPKALGSRK